jgi:2-oxo-3-hexenedioate decarboxylase
VPDPTRLADVLDRAVADRVAVPRLTGEHPDLDVDTAYAAQWTGVRRRIEAGERLVGAKLGLTSRAKQRTMGVDAPIYGWLTSGMQLDAGEPLPLDRWIHPRVEPEIAFLMGAELAGPASVVEVLAATEAVFAAVEVIDSRYADFKFTLPDVVADNASAAGYVAGPRLRPPGALGDLRLTGCVVRRDGAVAHTAAGAAVLGHPAAAVAWLASRLAETGRTIPAGAVVLSGALTDAVPIAAGQSVSVEIDGLGSIEVHA